MLWLSTDIRLNQLQPIIWLGLNLTSHIGWIGSTLLGALLGTLITNTDKIGLNFALPAMYICLLVLLVSKRSEVIVAALSAILCLLIGYLYPPSWPIYLI